MIRITDVQAVVARHYGIKWDDIIGDVRDREFAWPRQVAMYLAREATGHSLPVLGHWFHRHHTTIIHGIRQVEERAGKSRMLRRDLEALRERIGA